MEEVTYGMMHSVDGNIIIPSPPFYLIENLGKDALKTFPEYFL